MSSSPCRFACYESCLHFPVCHDTRYLEVSHTFRALLTEYRPKIDICCGICSGGGENKAMNVHPSLSCTRNQCSLYIYL